MSVRQPEFPAKGRDTDVCNGQRWARRIVSIVAVCIIVCSGGVARASQGKPSAPTTTQAATGDQASINETHDKLVTLLWKDRKVSAFVAHDPQLLADREFI